MKKIYTTIFIAMMGFATANMHAQCSLAISPSAPTVCSGDVVTLTATATPPSTAVNLPTTMAAGNNHRGNMFDITATNTIVIDSFAASPMGNTTIEIYYKAGSYSGFENTPGAWTLVGSAAVTSLPLPTPTPVPVFVNVTIPAGQTYAFYVTSSNTAVSLNYTDGTAAGNVFASDANIAFKEGVGMEYPFTAGSGSTFSPRVWNGVIYYSLPSTATISYMWSTTETTATIAPTVTSNSQYIVAATVTGCPTLIDTVDVAVSVPPVFAGNDTAICAGNSITLSGSGAVSYSWDNSVVDGASFSPTASNLYTVTGTDGFGCTATDQINVTVNTLPTVSAGTDMAVCSGMSATLSGSGANTYTWDNSVVDGVAFSPSATMSYIVTGTDANGCMDTDTVQITVNSNPIINGGNDTALCAGSSLTLSGSGAVSYVWDNGVMNNVAFVPASTTNYTVIGTDGNGCTGTDMVSVTVNTVNTTTAVSGGTITAAETPATYQWINCATGNPLSGETAQSFTATTGGNYAVIILDANGCQDTSSCQSITFAGISNVSNEQPVISAFPNPNNGSFTLQTTVTGTFVLQNELGQEISSVYLNASNNFTATFNNLATGFYFVKPTNNNSKGLKIVVTH